MATQPAPLDTWQPLPDTTDEQARILRAALRIGDRARAALDERVWLERWEATLLVSEALRPGPVGREALVLLQSRAAEWVAVRALRDGSGDPAPHVALLAWILEAWGEVRASLPSDPPGAVEAIEARLADLKRSLDPAEPRLAPVVAWPAPAAAASSAGDEDESIPDYDAADLPVEPEPVRLAAVPPVAAAPLPEPTGDLAADDLVVPARPVLVAPLAPEPALPAPLPVAAEPLAPARGGSRLYLVLGAGAVAASALIAIVLLR